MLYIIYVVLLFIMIAQINYWVCKKLKIEKESYKYKTLTGLRGICATFVVISHTFWRWGNESNHYWDLNVLKSANLLPMGMQMGNLSVGFFFILSGFLFFKYAMNPNKSDIEFFKNRFWRLYPAILFSIFLIFLTVIILGNSYLLPVCYTQFLNILPTPFGPFDDTFICGYRLFFINSGVLWSLVWEIRLYLFIPILCMLFKYTKKYITTNIILIILTFSLYFLDILNNNQATFIMLFLCGFMAAALEKTITMPNYFFWIGIILFVLLYHYVGQPYYSPYYTIALFLVFYPIMKGYNPFNLFNNEKAQYLGITSFSIYLNHGVFQFLSKYYLYHEGYLIWQIVSAILIATAAPFMYKYIELKYNKK